MFAELDPDQVDKAIRRRIIFLARYGRQSILQWEDVDYAEMRAWSDELKELLSEEKVSSSEDV